MSEFEFWLQYLTSYIVLAMYLMSLIFNYLIYK